MEALVARAIAMVVFIILLVGAIFTGIKLKNDSTTSSEANMLVQILGTLSQATAQGSVITATDIYNMSTRFGGAAGTFPSNSGIACTAGSPATCTANLPSSGAAGALTVVTASATISGGTPNPWPNTLSFINIASVTVQDCAALRDAGLGSYIYSGVVAAGGATAVAGCPSATGAIQLPIH